MEPVSEEAITDIECKTDKRIILLFAGSMKVHQVCWTKASGHLMFRKLRCFECAADAV